MRSLLVLLVLGGCASGTSPQDRCRAQAYADPAVKDATERANTQLQMVRAPALIQRDALLNAAIRRCLGAAGGAPRGGVESPKTF